jgi:capsular exopolysaccharide synthesis family protein
MNHAPVLEPLDVAQERRRLPNLQDYLRVLWRYRWGVLGLALAGAALAALHAWSQVPIYRATATMLIERQAARFVPIDPVYQAPAGYDFGEYYQTQYEILRSRPIAERVVRRIGVDAFDGGAGDARGFSLRRLLPGADAPAAQPGDAERFEAAVAAVQGSIAVQPIRNSQLVRIAFEGPDPALAARLANTLPQAYIEETLEGRLQMTEAASAWLNERLGGLREKLDQSERALQEFRDRERLIDAKGVDSLASQELQLATERLAQARRERSDREILYRAVRDARQAGTALDAIPGLLSYPLVSELKAALVEAERAQRELSQRYGPRHPRMVEAQSALDTSRAALARQLEAAASAVERDFEAAQLRENQVAGELGAAKGEVRDVNRKQYELQRLEREVQANRDVYAQFQQQFKQTAAAGGVQNANARLIEAAAVPDLPVAPNQRRIVLVGLLLGLALGVGLAFLLEHLDNTLKGADDVEQRLGLHVLGLLPKLDIRGDDERAPLRQFDENPRSTFSEAVRTVRTSVLLSAIDEPHKRVLVTSSVPGEGKTTLSVNLAHALGQMKRVLLIDADMRRPTVHRGLPDLAESRGLSHLVAGTAGAAECVHRLGEGNVWVLPAGPVPPNPQELLSSRRFEETLEQLSAEFDHVVIDCAPACAVSDALVLSRLVHAVVYVVRSDATPWQVADQGVRRLRRVNAPMTGAVVNHVVPRKGRFAYGYGKYYYGGDGYYHDYGYGKGKA